MSSGTGLLARSESVEYVYDEPKAEGPQLVTADAAEEWSHPDVVDEALKRLRSLGRAVEAERIEESLRAFDALHDGPIILDSTASARLDEVMASRSGPLPEPPLSLEAFPSE